MKFIANTYRLLILLAILLATSCSHNEELQIVPDSNADKVHFTIGVSLPGISTTDSRAFGGEGNTDGTGSGGYFEFSDLYVAVFVEIDGISYLEEFVKAESTVPTWNSDGYWDFGVTLTKTDGPRRLHLIANYPNLTMGFGEEGQLIGRLLANGTDHDVYWNYRDLELIDDGYERQLRNVPLIRNYVQIRLDKRNLSSTNFILDQYALYNVPTKGTVAPYNPSGTDKFANFVDKENQCQSYTYMLDTEKYVGNEPFDDGDFLANTIDWKDPDVPTYIYERNHSNTNQPTCMLIKGRYVQSGEPTSETQPTYYKLDFVYEDSQNHSKVYYNLLRNFIFTMNIKSVTGPGYDSVEEALKQPASNNIGGDAVAEDYTNISNGIGRLFVSSTYMLFTEQKTVYLYYKYVPDIIEAPTTTANVNVSITPQTGDVINLDASLEVSTETVGQYAGWNKLKLVSHAVQTESKSQNIIFAAGGLQRKVELVLRTPYRLTVDVLQEEVAKTAKQLLDVQIVLPGGIAESLFPLRLFISSQDNTIYPDYGTNMPAEAQNGKYGFIKEISWDEYQGSKTYTCKFLTNCAESATQVYVDNEYFNRGQDSFENFEPSNFQNLIFNPTSVTTGVIGENVTFSFNMPTLPTPANVTVTLNGLEPNDSKLTHIKDNADGTKQYKYTPSTTGTQTFNLKTTIDNGTASVKLEASQYNMAQKTLNVSRSYTIPAGNIKVGNVAQEITLYVSYSSRWNNDPLGISFTPSGNNNNKQNGYDIVISAENYRRIMEDENDTIYLRYSTGGMRTTYYLASVSLSKLLDGTAQTLTFTQQ